MEMTEQRRIAAPREAVFAALSDPDILAQAIPGCDSLEKLSDTEFAAQVTAKVGPVKAKFKGQVTLSDINPPEGYTITGEGKGGAAGFAKGGAVITLTEDGDGTLMSYEVKAEVGGKLAQLGARLIEGTSKKLAGEFFESFETLVGAESGDAAAPAETGQPAQPEAPAAAPATASAAPQTAETGTWILYVIAGAALGLYLVPLLGLGG